MGLFRRRHDAKPIADPVLPYPQDGQVPGTRSRAHKSKLQRTPFALKLAAYTTLSAALGCALWLGAMLIYYTIAFPDPLAVRGKETAPIIRIVARDGTLLAKRGAAHDYMPIDMMPRHVLDAVVATEDRRFFSHWGIDPAGLARAVFANLRAGRFVQGGSTLTQQLAKNLFLTSERTLSRKLDELALAFWLEVRLSKREILELYLNRVYFGGGAYGIEAAAQRYFDKSARALSVAEAALIAGLLKAPSKYAPTTSKRAAISRTRSVLAKMEAAGVIDHAAYRRAWLERLRFANFKDLRGRTGFEYAIDMALDKLPPILGTEYSEMIVETTIDAALQKHANAALISLLDGKGKEMGAGQAALVSLDHEGAIRVLIGGRSYPDSQFNRATKARRQPGSVFKPFVYLTALERGMKPDTITYDLPLTIGGWSPRNDNGTHVGALTLRQALAQSVNTVAVRLATDVGLSAVAATARRLGVRSELRQDASMALGTSEATLLEMVGAYGAFADGGIQVEPHIIRRVRLNTGRVLYARGGTPQRRVAGISAVGALNDMLNSALIAGTGRRAALPRHPAAGKTGTTQDFRDAWFVGYTAHMTTGVWIGNDDGTPMREVMGGNLPALMWRSVMLEAHKDLQPTPLPGTAPLDAVADRAGLPPLARSSGPEQLPWLASRPLAVNSYVMREGRSASRVIADIRTKRSAPAAAPAPSRPVGRSRAVSVATARGGSRVIGQRLIIEPPKVRPLDTNRPLPTPYPSERISEDFLARVLETEGAGGRAVASAGSAFDADAIQRQLEALPDEAPGPSVSRRGLMALGAGQ